MTIGIINPKAKKLIEDLESLELISIHNNENDWHKNQLFMEELNERLANYMQNKNSARTWN